MGILRKEANAYFIYEETELGFLVAISKEDQSGIKKYWKSKDKSKVDSKIKGFRFVQTDEQETLKIDFTEEVKFEIANLKKFD